MAPGLPGDALGNPPPPASGRRIRCHRAGGCRRVGRHRAQGSHREHLDGWYTPLNAFLSIGP
ncbi:hypothetical protein ABT083_16455, partial [Streptomyces goshikiensis]|uniref:hypothetical protein n=1 Tax=Streptomyces goshikiensis TaxID=1942 RepID=UPI00332365DD